MPTPIVPVRMDENLKDVLVACADNAGLTLSDLLRLSALQQALDAGLVDSDFEFKTPTSGSAKAAELIEDHRNKKGGKAAA